jgi:capsular exopolysaccharide synthesis family protein
MADPARVRDLAPYRGAAPAASPGEGEPEGRALPLSHYIWVLKWHRWKILAFIAVSLLSTWVVSSRLTPLYEASATIDVDRQMPRGAMGDTMGSPIISPVDADQFLATQTNLIKSDSVLRPVAQRFHLRPLSDPDGASGSESKVELNARAAALQDAPVRLPTLEVSRPPNTYLLQVKYRSADRRLAADVANAVADSYLEHYYRIRITSSEKLGSYMTGQLENLKAKMELSSQHLVDFERELNVINPDQKTSIQSASLLQLNSDYNTVKEERLRREAAYNATRSGSLNAAWASTQGDSLRKLAESLDEARLRLVQNVLHFGENHPEMKNARSQVEELQRQLEERKQSIVDRVAIEYQEALDRENMLRDQVTETRAEFDRINASSFDYQTLKEEADADKKLYTELVRKIREAGINASFQDSAIRITDRARPPASPVFPKTQMNLLMALVLSGALAFGAVIVNDLADNTIRDPEEVSRSLRVAVAGTLPAVRGLKGRKAQFMMPASHLQIMLADDWQTESGNDRSIPGRTSPARTGYDEAVRTLRNSVLLTDFNSRLRSILVTSAAPAEGKSTVAAHLAAAHAEQGNRTLLIDGDLRRPSIHKFFGNSNDKGLSNVLFGSIPWAEAIADTSPGGNLRIMPAGPFSRRAADLLGRTLPQILEEAAREYDLIILDSPPLIGFPEPLQMAASVDGVLVVARAGHTNRKGVASVLAMLNRLHANIVGVVLNEVTPGMSDSYYYHHYYSRYYRLDSKNMDVRGA